MVLYYKITTKRCVIDSYIDSKRQGEEGEAFLEKNSPNHYLQSMQNFV